MEQVIKALIKDEVKSTKLVIGLNNMGVEASNFHLNLSNTILTIVGVKLNDEEFDRYDKMYEEVLNIDIEDNKSLNQLTNKIYRYLMKIKH
jgi:hypothetical protein